MTFRSNQLPTDLEKGEVEHNSMNESLSPQSFTAELNEDNKSSTDLLRVRTSNNGDIVYLGKQAFKKSELENAFAGSLNPGVHPSPHRPLGNPVPLGLAGFSICCLFAGFVNAQAGGVTDPGLLAGAALLLGGLVEAVAGFLCLFIENTFAGTALGAFSGFWMSYAFVIADVWGIKSSYSSVDDFNMAFGFYLICWVFFGILLWLCTFKSTYPFFIMFLLVWVFNLCLAIGCFTGSTGATKAGGILGIITAVNGFYIIYAGLADHENSYLIIPATPMPNAPVV